jgi:hypothetical protein
MSTINPVASDAARATFEPAIAERHDRAHRRAVKAISVIALSCAALLIDLLLVGHTSGEEIWGPITAAAGTAVGVLSLAYLIHGGRSRAARIALYALWVMVAFFGFGGYNDHRRTTPADVADTRPRPPLAPLVFTGLGLAGAAVLRYEGKEH